MSSETREVATPPPATAVQAEEAEQADNAVDNTSSQLEERGSPDARKEEEEGKKGDSGEEAKAVDDESGPPENGQRGGKTAAEAAHPKGRDVDDGPSGVTNGTPASSRKSKRKSSGVPEHRSRKLHKKKSQALTNVNAKAGDFYLARLKGHPPWPSVVADEEMLPQALLASRGVSAKRADGTYREDYADGGKRVNERTFPVMFLGTNQFAWIINTDLMSFDVDAVEDQKRPRKPGLDDAYQIASEKHDLAWFKNLLKDHEKDIEAEQKAAAESKRSKSKRKSKVVVDEDDDVVMEDAADDDDGHDDDEVDKEAEKKSKSRKRKKDVDSDVDENKKPAKTPKRKESTKVATTTTPRLKLTNPKTPNGTEGAKSANKTASAAKGAKSKSASTKKSTAKAKAEAKAKESSDGSESSAKAEPEQMTPAEKQEQRNKELLFYRHRLQRGLLTRDHAPLEDEMQAMSDFIHKLETFPDLDANMVRDTKMNKVLKGIIRLASIPKEEEFNFRQRSHALLQKWSQSLTKEPDTPTAASAGAKDDSESHGNGTATKENGVKAADDAEHPIAEGKNDDGAKDEQEDGKDEQKDGSEGEEKTQEDVASPQPANGGKAKSSDVEMDVSKTETAEEEEGKNAQVSAVETAPVSDPKAEGSAKGEGETVAPAGEAAEAAA